LETVGDMLSLKYVALDGHFGDGFLICDINKRYLWFRQANG